MRFHSRRATPRRRGYVLPWIIVTIAIVATLAAVAAPVLSVAHDVQRVEDTADMVRQIAGGIVAFEAAVHSTNNNSNNYPGQLSQLASPIRPSVDRNSCGQLMTSRDSTDWMANGPFVSFFIPAGGLWTPLGRLRDSIPARTSKGALYVEIPGMPMSDALLADSLIDHGVGDTVTVLHAAPSAPLPDTTTLQIRLLSASDVIQKC